MIEILIFFIFLIKVRFTNKVITETKIHNWPCLMASSLSLRWVTWKLSTSGRCAQKKFENNVKVLFSQLLLGFCAI